VRRRREFPRRAENFLLSQPASPSCARRCSATSSNAVTTTTRHFGRARVEQRLPPLPMTGWRMIQKPFDVRRMVSLVIELAESDTRAIDSPPA